MQIPGLYLQQTRTPGVELRNLLGDSDAHPVWNSLSSRISQSHFRPHSMACVRILSTQHFAVCAQSIILCMAVVQPQSDMEQRQNPVLEEGCIKHLLKSSTLILHKCHLSTCSSCSSLGTRNLNQTVLTPASSSSDAQETGQVRLKSKPTKIATTIRPHFVYLKKVRSTEKCLPYLLGLGFHLTTAPPTSFTPDRYDTFTVPSKAVPNLPLPCPKAGLAKQKD